MTLVLEPENRPQIWRIKNGLSQKTALVQQKILYMDVCLKRYPFISTNPPLAAMRFISFFFLFFLPNFCKILKSRNSPKKSIFEQLKLEC